MARMSEDQKKRRGLPTYPQVKVENLHTSRINGIPPGEIGEVDEPVAERCKLLKKVGGRPPKAKGDDKTEAAPSKK